jgi:hypothetical protein
MRRVYQIHQLLAPHKKTPIAKLETSSINLILNDGENQSVGRSYLRHSNMSLGSGRATICGGGSCSATNRVRDPPEPKQIESSRGRGRGAADLAERVVLLLEALEAALVGHGQNPRTAAAGTEPLPIRSNPPARARAPIRRRQRDPEAANRGREAGDRIGDLAAESGGAGGGGGSAAAFPGGGA